jgi:hypothetical protein
LAELLVNSAELPANSAEFYGDFVSNGTRGIFLMPSSTHDYNIHQIVTLKDPHC